ncbi:MAG: adenylate cyclase, partial [Clostridia bacterium]|nr:adenylate cyclase [Clostridia bacterium]
HMVGGVTALIGAMMLGPRIGKYITDKKTGKKTAKAIPGHSITLGALGVFILWFGWYGFNGAAATDLSQLGSIFLTTTVAPSVATCTTMLFTWFKNGKPDVSMSLNGSLAGLVAITAPCACVDAFGSAVIGLVAGILVVVAVEFLDLKCHVDDPVGAVAVHGVNGLWGTLAVGLFSTESGLFYGGGLHQLGIQALGVSAILAWTIVTMTIVFFIIKKTNGLRVSAEEEIIGLDLPEHGLVSAYADFMPSVPTVSVEELVSANSAGTVPVEDAVPVELKPSAQYVSPVRSDGVKITKVQMLIKQEKFEALKEAMMDIGITGMTVSHVLGCGVQKGKPEYYRGVKQDITLLPKVQVDIVISKVPVATVIETAKHVLYTGHIGDGKIFVYNVEDVIKVRTGETGYDALQDVE